MPKVKLSQSVQDKLHGVTREFTAESGIQLELRVRNAGTKASSRIDSPAIGLSSSGKYLGVVSLKVPGSEIVLMRASENPDRKEFQNVLVGGLKFYDDEASQVWNIWQEMIAQVS